MLPPRPAEVARGEEAVAREVVGVQDLAAHAQEVQVRPARERHRRPRPPAVLRAQQPEVVRASVLAVGVPGAEEAVGAGARDDQVAADGDALELAAHRARPGAVDGEHALVRREPQLAARSDAEGQDLAGHVDAGGRGVAAGGRSPAAGDGERQHERDDGSRSVACARSRQRPHHGTGAEVGSRS